MPEIPENVTAPPAPGETMDVLCSHCDRSYRIPAALLPSATPLPCPHCFQAQLRRSRDADVEGTPAFETPSYPPELVVPFSVNPATMAQQIETFAGGIPFAPRDLNPATLQTRLRAVFWPVWLVDSAVQATWQAEMGFDYRVVSHQERYQDSRGWDTREVEETRVRWEPRLGRLQRNYENVMAPALEEDAQLRQKLGTYTLADAETYTPPLPQEALLRQPDRAPDAAWPAAEPAFRERAMDECREACEAQHVRSFRWSPQYGDPHWTLLLLPLYSTYYLDDEEQPQPVLIHGQSGHVSGTRRASMKRAQRAALIIAIVAVVLFVLSLSVGVAGAFFPPLLAVAFLGGILAVAVGVGALWPIVRAWQFNRRQEKR